MNECKWVSVVFYTRSIFTYLNATLADTLFLGALVKIILHALLREKWHAIFPTNKYHHTPLIDWVCVCVRAPTFCQHSFRCVLLFSCYTNEDTSMYACSLRFLVTLALLLLRVFVSKTIANAAIMQISLQLCHTSLHLAGSYSGTYILLLL